MKKKFWLPILLSAVVINTGWAATTKTAAKPVKAAAKPAATTYAVTMLTTSTFDAGQSASKLTLTAAPDEFEPGSFTAKSAKAFSDVTVKLAGDLVAGKNRLASNQVRISEVEGDQLMPVAPSGLQAGSARRYWVTVNVPLRTAAGTYKGDIVAVSGGKAVGKLPIEVTVLPMRLLTSSKQYGYTLRTSGTVGMTCDQMLRKLREYGFGLTSVSVTPEELPTALKSVRDAQLGTTIPYIWPGLTLDEVKQASDIAKTAGITRLYYAVDYNSTDPEVIQKAGELIEAMRAKRIKTFAVVSDPAAYDSFAASLDYAALHVDLPYIQGLVAGEKRVNSRHDWYYWDINTDARIDRLNAGLLLWKIGLDGAFIPYRADSHEAVSNVEPLFSTIQGEALREGVDDTRYITSMMSILREIKDALKVGGTKNATVAKQTADEAEAYLNAVLAKPLMTLKNQDYQDIRAKLAQYTIKLQAQKK